MAQAKQENEMRTWCMVTVKRPNGIIEVIRHPSISVMTVQNWTKFCEQMKQAGKGNPISYENKSRETSDPKNEQEMREVCDHQDRMAKVMTSL